MTRKVRAYKISDEHYSKAMERAGKEGQQLATLIETFVIKYAQYGITEIIETVKSEYGFNGSVLLKSKGAALPNTPPNWMKPIVETGVRDTLDTKPKKAQGKKDKKSFEVNSKVSAKNVLNNAVGVNRYLEQRRQSKLK